MVDKKKPTGGSKQTKQGVQKSKTEKAKEEILKKEVDLTNNEGNNGDEESLSNGGADDEEEFNYDANDDVEE